MKIGVAGHRLWCYLAGLGVGVDEGYDPYFLSIASRMAAGFPPELNRVIASRATSMQMAQPIPCESHSVTRPSAARDFTKHE
jgi:hypothetical protein